MASSVQITDADISKLDRGSLTDADIAKFDASAKETATAPKSLKDKVWANINGTRTPPMFQSGMGGGEPDTTGAIGPAMMAGATVAMGGPEVAGAMRAGGKAVAKYGIQAARDLATAYIAGEGVSRGLKAIGVNSTLADIGGLLAGMGAAGTLEQILGKETLDKLAAKAFEEKYGRVPTTAGEKLQARGEAQAQIADARNASRTKVPKTEAKPAAAPQAPAPAASTLAPEPEVSASRYAPTDKWGPAAAKLKNEKMAAYFKEQGIDPDTVSKMTESELNGHLKANGYKTAARTGSRNQTHRSYAETRTDIYKAMKGEK